MDLSLSADERAFQDEVRAFLDEALTPELRAAGPPRHQRVLRAGVQPALAAEALHAKGWVAPSWPTQYGGAGWSEMQRYIFAAECARAGAPSLAPMGLRMVGPCLMGYGTAEQKAFYLPRILSGEDYWCQGYSEPGAGSDLASLQLRADSRRRRLRPQRLEDLDHPRPLRQPHVLPGAHPLRGQAAAGDHLPAAGDGDAGDHRRSRSSPWPATTRSTRCSSTTSASRSPGGSARRTRAGPSPSTCWSSSAAAARPPGSRSRSAPRP